MSITLTLTADTADDLVWQLRRLLAGGPAALIGPAYGHAGAVGDDGANLQSALAKELHDRLETGRTWQLQDKEPANDRRGCQAVPAHDIQAYGGPPVEPQRW